MSDLLPCPFCGSDAEVIGTQTTIIRCTDDQCISRCDMGGYNNWGHSADAIAAWNTRAPDMAERVAIVAWLRDQDGHGYDDMRADAIETLNAHLQAKEDGLKVRDRRIETLNAEVERLRAAGAKLNNHACHDDECQIVTHGVWSDPIPCTCGYESAWKAWSAALGDTE